MPEVLGLAGILVAVVIVLLLIAAWVFAEMLARAFGAVPFIGGWVGSHIRSAVTVATVAVGELWDWAVADLGWLFAAAAVWGWEWLYAGSRALGHAVNLGAKAESDAATAIGLIGPSVAAGVTSAVHTAEGFAGQVGANVLAEAEGLYNQAVAHADAGVASAERVAAGLFDTAAAALSALAAREAADVAHLAGDVSGLTALLAGDVTALVGQITASLNVAVATAEQAAAAAESQAVNIAGTLAQEAAGGAVAALDLAAHDLVLGPWQALLPVLEPIAGALDPAVAGVLGLPGVLGGALPVSVPGILALIVSGVAGISAELDDCLVPNCRALKSAGSLFNGLEELGIAGLLMALAAEAVTNPETAVDAVIAGTGWVPDLLTGLVDAVLG